MKEVVGQDVGLGTGLAAGLKPRVGVTIDISRLEIQEAEAEAEVLDVFREEIREETRAV